MLAVELGAVELALVPGRAIVSHVAQGQVVEAFAAESLLGGLADIQVGPVDLVVAGIEAQSEQGIPANVLVRGDVVVSRGGSKDAAVDLAYFLAAVAGAPAVAVAEHADDAEFNAAEIERGSAGNFVAAVERNAVIVLQQVHFGVGEGLSNGLEFGRREVSALDALARRHGAADRDRDFPRAIVKADDIRIRSEIGEAVFSGCFGIVAAADADFEEGLGRHVQRTKVNDAAAELARILDRVGLLDQHVFENLGREKIERNDPLERFGAGERRAVEARCRIALAEAAHIHKAAFSDAEAGDARKRVRCVGITLTREIFGRQIGGNFRRAAEHFGNVASEHHNFVQPVVVFRDFRRGLDRRRCCLGLGFCFRFSFGLSDGEGRGEDRGGRDQQGPERQRVEFHGSEILSGVFGKRQEAEAPGRGLRIVSLH